MTQNQAAARLQVSRSTYYRMVQAGTIHPRRISRAKTLVARGEVDALLAGRAYHRDAAVEVQDRRQLYGKPNYPLAGE